MAGTRRRRALSPCAYAPSCHPCPRITFRAGPDWAYFAPRLGRALLAGGREFLIEASAGGGG